MAKKKATVLPQVVEPNINSTIDLKINMKDLIDMVVADEEVRLKELRNSLEEEVEKLKDEFEKIGQKEIKDFFIKKFGKFVTSLGRKLDVATDIHSGYCDGNPIFCAYVEGDRYSNIISLRLRISEFGSANLKKLYERHGEVHKQYHRVRDELSSLNDKAKSAKVGLVKQQLQRSQEGQAILQMVSQAKKFVLPASK